MMRWWDIEMVRWWDCKMVRLWDCKMVRGSEEKIIPIILMKRFLRMDQVVREAGVHGWDKIR